MNGHGTGTAFGGETFGLEHVGGEFDHIRIAAEEDLGVGRVEREAGFLFEHALFHEGLDAAGVAVEMRVLVGAGDAGDVGEIGAEAGEAFEFAAVAEVPAITGAMQDDEPALVVIDQQGTQHGDIGGEAGAGGDEDDGFFGGDAVNGEDAAGLGAEEHAAAMFQGEEAGGELAAGDEGEIKFDIAPFQAGGGDAIGAADHFIGFPGLFLGHGFGDAGGGTQQTEDAKLAGFEFKQVSV